MPDFHDFSLLILILIFLISAGVIGFAGTKLAHVAEELAEKTGLGQAIVGAVFIGISTSLPGVITSFSTAWQGHPSLAISNAIGGIAAQTVFLVVSDMLIRKVNLEHAAASLANLAQGTLLIGLLGLPVLAMASPEITFFQIHPMSVILVVAYFAGIRVVGKTKADPMWRPKKTRTTQVDEESHEPHMGSLKKILPVFLVLITVLFITGVTLAQSAIALADKSGFSETAVGSLITGVITSLPELITAIAAVKAGAYNLAVGNIIGGNSFDVLFIAGSDLFYRGGSIYHAFNDSHILVIMTTVVMTAMLLMGMLRRERVGPAGIGFESMVILLIYIAMVGMLLV